MRVIAFLLVTWLVLTAAPTLAATEHDGADVDAESNGNGILVSGEQYGESGELPGQTISPTNDTADGDKAPQGHWVQTNACSTVSASGCVASYTCPDGSLPVVWTYVLDDGGSTGSYSQCPGEPEPTKDTPPVGIPGEVRRAFERVPLPDSQLVVQPPGGRTLVNLPTIFSTRAAPFSTTVELRKIGLSVTLDIRPVAYTWHHGDETTQETDHPGGTYAEETAAGPTCATRGGDVPCVTHIYTRSADTLGASVDTTWAAAYQVDGSGPWRDVDGTVTIAGASQDLTVVEAVPQLVR